MNIDLRNVPSDVEHNITRFQKEKAWSNTNKSAALEIIKMHYELEDKIFSLKSELRETKRELKEKESLLERVKYSLQTFKEFLT